MEQINAAIPLGVKPLNTDSSANQLAMMESAAKLGEYQQNISRTNALRGLDRTDPNYLNKVYQIDPALGMKFEEHTAGVKKNIAQAGKAESENIAARIKLQQEKLGNVSTPEQFLAWSNSNHDDPVLGPYFASQGMTREKSNAQTMDTLQKPGGFQQLMGSAMLGSAELYKQNNISATDKAKLNQAASFHNDVQNRPQYIQTDAGLVAVPNVLKSGQTPTGVPVLGANGENLGKPLKAIPSNINTAIINNDTSLKKVNRTLDLIEGKDVTTPEGVVMKGSADATGIVPGMMGHAIAQRWDPGGTATRAMIADIGSLKIHDRSGAAVTASESPRLKPFIPSVWDTPEAAATKLKQFKAEYEDIQRGLTETYSKDQGYRPSPVLNSGSNAGSTGNRRSLDSIFNPKK